MLLIFGILLLGVTAQGQTTGYVSQGIQRVGKGISLLEEKMKALEETERNLMIELDNDNQDMIHIGLRKDRQLARQKIREEKRALRKIARTKRMVLAKMYKILRVLAPVEQGRLVRQLNLMNRLHVNHLMLLGADEAQAVFNYGFVAQPQVDQFRHEGMIMQGNDMGDYLMKDKETDEVEKQKKKMEEVEQQLRVMEQKYSTNPYLKNSLKQRSAEVYNKLMDEMVVKIEKAISKRGKESYILARKIDDQIEQMEMKMELMTPEKRLETVKKINIMKKQRKNLDGNVEDYRSRLMKMMNKLKQSSLVMKKAAKKANKMNNYINKKHLSKETVVKHGTAAVLDILEKKAGIVIDTNKKQKGNTMKLMSINRTAPKTVIKKEVKKGLKSKQESAEEIIKKTAIKELKKIEQEEKKNKQKKQTTTKKNILLNKEIKPSVIQSKKSLQKQKKLIKKLSAMEGLLKEMAASKEMVEEEIHSALEI
ncbi:hypothetical protein, conserved [Entamoeba dispar SAW760]|uniref:Uncharacterized protein n=1 Tax=Entamoeba dispar (strain ATCC PRA-260 / SAW760) TaxID=370354 RepID=B0EG52_ENTDS|nr:uncharacterized protein EDI_115790 [Entamoeba dispar SAW760]EDR26479.1 hypothetical protein, conserved [Entamoeba dispar SAW760]|eukprot:EDR26479.1 hypothetical protein, conserved [Entamoeba dispar SAW760]